MEWEEALDVAAKELEGLRGSGSPIGLLSSGRATNEEAFLAVRLTRAALRTPHLGSPLQGPFRAILAGIGDGLPGWVGSGTGGMEALEAELVILLEGGVADSHPQVAYRILQTLRKGGRLVVVSPERSLLGSLAASHLALDPLNPAGFIPGLREALSNLGPVGKAVTVLSPFSPDRTLLRAAVGSLMGVLGAWAGEMNVSLRVLPLPPRCNSLGTLHMGLAPDLLPGARPLEDPGARARLAAAWSRLTAVARGFEVEEISQKVDGLILLREDVRASAPLPQRFLQALGKLRSLVVLDAFRSPASEAATVSLPLGAFSETEGTITSLDGRVQRWVPAASPVGASREGWWVLAELLARLEPGPGFQGLEKLARQVGEVIPEYAGYREESVAGPWGWDMERQLFPEEGEKAEAFPSPAGRPEVAPGAFRLALTGAFDWEDDPAVDASPTLRRDGAAQRKRFPGGRVTMSQGAAEALGIREGWKVRLKAGDGQVEVPVTLSGALEGNLLLAPFRFRESFFPVMGGRGAVTVSLEAC